VGPDEELAERVRRHCLEAAIAAWEDAGISGLCAEGRWEAAVEALRRLDLREALRDRAAPGSSHSTPRRLP